MTTEQAVIMVLDDLARKIVIEIRQYGSLKTGESDDAVACVDVLSRLYPEIYAKWVARAYGN